MTRQSRPASPPRTSFSNSSTALSKEKIADNKQTQLAAIDLESLSAQIEKQKQKIKELSGGEENQITSNVSGTVQSIEITAGQTVP